MRKITAKIAPSIRYRGSITPQAFGWLVGVPLAILVVMLIGHIAI